jgi:hypothetical protein
MPRTRKTLRRAGRDWVASCPENDGNQTCQFHKDWNDTIPRSQNDVGFQFDDSGGIGSHDIHVIRGPTLVELDIPALDPTQPQQLAPERPNASLAFSVVLREWHQDANPPHALLLRPSRNRPCHCRAADQRDEIATLHILPRTHDTASYRFDGA